MSHSFRAVSVSIRHPVHCIASRFNAPPAAGQQSASARQVRIAYNAAYAENPRNHTVGSERTGAAARRERARPNYPRAQPRAARPCSRGCKKKLLPFYQKVKESDPELWRGWDIDDALEALLVRTLRMKPMRTASGVATVTVLTKPWPCASACLYCPNDIRMPKSYLADEPACQRAERNWFDPYLQVALRLRTLTDMGHTTDKVEPHRPRRHLDRLPARVPILVHARFFRALNEAADADAQRASIAGRRAFYEHCGVLSERDDLAAFARNEQARVTCGEAHLQPGGSRTLRERRGLAAGKQKPDGRARRRHPRARAQHAGHASLGGTCH